MYSDLVYPNEMKFYFIILKYNHLVVLKSLDNQIKKFLKLIINL